MLAIRLLPDSLDFEVRHHKNHGSSDCGPNVPFRIVLGPESQARLFKMDEKDGGSGLVLTRRH